jgi:Flp pilus assembly pilin Flp
MLFYQKGELAQGLVEYALVIVLVSVAVMLALGYLAPSIGNLFSEVGDALDG